MGLTDLFACAPRTSCRTSALTRLVHTAMAYAFVVWLLATGFTGQDALFMLAGVLSLIAVTAMGLSPQARALLARVLEPAPGPVTAGAA